MSDRSSCTNRSPRRTPNRTEPRIVKARLARLWGTARIAHLLDLAQPTVHRVLTRCWPREALSGQSRVRRRSRWVTARWDRGPSPSRA